MSPGMDGLDFNAVLNPRCSVYRLFRLGLNHFKYPPWVHGRYTIRDLEHLD